MICILQKRSLVDSLSDFTGEAAELAETMIELLERRPESESSDGLSLL